MNTDKPLFIRMDNKKKKKYIFNGLIYPPTSHTRAHFRGYHRTA